MWRRLNRPQVAVLVAISKLRVGAFPVGFVVVTRRYPRRRAPVGAVLEADLCQGSRTGSGRCREPFVEVDCRTLANPAASDDERLADEALDFTENHRSRQLQLRAPLRPVAFRRRTSQTRDSRDCGNPNKVMKGLVA